MRKFQVFTIVILLTGLGIGQALALDPVAPRSFRPFGMIYVKTPNPPTDKITLTNLKTQARKDLKSDEIKVVKVGRYNVTVKMQDYTYSQDVNVDSTERTDVVVPGYGNLLVNAPGDQITIEVYQSGKNKLIAKFPANQVKTLPRGYYDVKIMVGKFTLTEPKVWVVTNTTRILDVIEHSKSGGQMVRQELEG